MQNKDFLDVSDPSPCCRYGISVKYEASQRAVRVCSLREAPDREQRLDDDCKSIHVDSSRGVFQTFTRSGGEGNTEESRPPPAPPQIYCM